MQPHSSKHGHDDSLVLNHMRSVGENEIAKWALVSSPDTAGSTMAGLHPAGALFDKGFSKTKSAESHKALRAALTAANVEVVEISEVLKTCTKEELASLSSECIRYELSGSSQRSHKKLSGTEEVFLSNAYKRQCIMDMDVDHIVDTIFMNPSVILEQSQRNTPVMASSYHINPLGNLVFTRDQQIVTNQGVVLANLQSNQRNRESKVIEFALRKLGISIVAKIPPEVGTLEGGDFLGYNEDLCFIGTGIRTNGPAVQYLLDNNHFGTTRVAVVRDIFDRQQERMHLDCVFNIAHDKVCVLLESLIGDSPSRRLVTEFTYCAESGYHISKTDVEFSEYLKNEGFHIIPISEEYQEGYGINFINLGAGRLITIHEPTSKLLANDPVLKEKGVQITNIDFSGITCMFGGVHCATQVYRNKARYNTHVIPRRRLKSIKWDGYNIPGKATRHAQSTDSFLGVAPTAFGFSEESAEDNEFALGYDVMKISEMSSQEIRSKALKEYANLHKLITDCGVNFHLMKYDSDNLVSADSCFANNWFSTHCHGDQRMLTLYSMKNTPRRSERNPAVIKHLKKRYPILIDFTGFETVKPPSFLEGNGSLVLDRVNHVAYLCESKRSHKSIATMWATLTGYELVDFKCTVYPIFHTDMMLFIASNFAIVCPDTINEGDRKRVLDKIAASKRKIITITWEQVKKFCGNGIELRSTTSNGTYILFSTTAFEAFTEEQREAITTSGPNTKIIHSSINIIETVGGGSVNGLLAPLF